MGDVPYYPGPLSTDLDQMIVAFFFMMVVILTSAIIFTLMSIITIVAYWKIFESAGLDGWKAIIPFYNGYCLFDIAWGKPVYYFLTLIPAVGIVFSYIALYKLCKAFGRSNWFFAGMVVMPLIFIPVLGFGNFEYLGPQS